MDRRFNYNIINLGLTLPRAVVMSDYIKVHWQGRLGLLRSSLLNSVAEYLLLLIIGILSTIDTQLDIEVLSS